MAFKVNGNSCHSVSKTFKCLILNLEVESKRLLYLSVSTCAVIGQFSGPYYPVRPAKIKVNFVAKLFRDLSLSVLDFFALNYVIKRANDLKTISN